MPPRLLVASILRRSAGPLALLGLVLLLACSRGDESRLAGIATLQDAGRFDESIEPLRELLDGDPSLDEAHYRLGLALVRTGEPSRAIWPLERAASSPEQIVPAGLLLADTFVGLGAYSDALRIADRVLEVDPSQSEARRARSHALLGINRREEALVDARKLYDAMPEDFHAGLLYGTILAELGRLDEAETVHADVETAAQASADPERAARACLARASFLEDHRKDEARAEAHYRRCLQRAPAHPLALQLATRHFEKRGRPAEALVLWERAATKAPDDLAVRQALAVRYQRNGEIDRARNLLTEGGERIGSPDAWMALAEFERRLGRIGPALHAIERAEQATPRASERLLFVKADLLIDDGRIEAAEPLIAAFEEESYRALLEGRILLERGAAPAALAALERGLRRWPDNAGGRYLAGLAAREIGDFERAISEFREAVRADPGATDAALLLGSLELARGHPRDAVEAAASFLEHRGRARPDAYRVLLGGLLAQGLVDPARRVAEQIAAAGFLGDSAIAHARIEAMTSGPIAAVRVIEASGVELSDPENERVLRALADFRIAADRAAAALEAVDTALQVRPDSPSLHELRGVVLLRAGRRQDAQRAFEQALALDAGQARARAGLAEIAYAEGDAERALRLYDEAAQTKGADGSAGYAAAQIALAGGDSPGAKRRLEEVIRQDPGHAAARNDLAWLLAKDETDLGRALELATLAHRIDPNPDITDTLGFVHLQRGEIAAAVGHLEAAVAARPESPSMRYHLGVAWARQGASERAAAMLREAISQGPFPGADAARRALAELEHRDGVEDGP